MQNAQQPFWLTHQYVSSILKRLFVDNPYCPKWIQIIMCVINLVLFCHFIDYYEVLSWFQTESYTSYIISPRKLLECTVRKIVLKLLLHCCIKCPQNLQVQTLLQMYTAFPCRIYNKILLKVFDPRNNGNLLLKLQFFVL